MNKQLIIALATSTLAAQAQTYIGSDHVDIGIGYKPSGFDLHVHQEDPVDMEYEPGEVVFLIGNAAATASPGGAFSGFLGAAGSPIWVAPSFEVANVPYIGFGTEELDSADWIGNITLSLASVSGPGSFSLWNVDSFGAPNLFMSSAPGAASPNSLSLIPGSHGHYNLGFTAPGTYEVSFTASGTHITDGAVLSSPATYTFEVVPEPSTWAMLGLGSVALAWIAANRRR
jgi:surface-anchored protein